MEVTLRFGKTRLIMIFYKLLKMTADRLPPGFKPLARKLYYRDGHWGHPSMKKFGTVQDLYYWTSDGDLDSLLVLQNYFSALFPWLETATSGKITMYSSNGIRLGEKLFEIPKFGGSKLRASTLLKEFEASAENDHGVLEVHIEIPSQVVEHIKDQKSFYFWDRFYISYTNKMGQNCFVHGVDKTHIYRHGDPDPIDWTTIPENLEWSPETPVDIEDYEKFTVIMINRSSQEACVTLTLSDIHDHSESWTTSIASKGVLRFVLTAKEIKTLHPLELRMKVTGMVSQYGRPMVFKQFPNGAISAMHC